MLLSRQCLRQRSQAVVTKPAASTVYTQRSNDASDDGLNSDSEELRSSIDIMSKAVKPLLLSWLQFTDFSSQLITLFVTCPHFPIILCFKRLLSLN